MDPWLASTFWLSWIMLLWTLAYKHLFKSLLSLLSRIFPEMESLGHVILSITCRGDTVSLFVTVAPFYVPASNALWHCCEVVFRVATMVISKHYIKINAEQEIRVTVFNLTPRSENSACVPFVSNCGCWEMKYDFFLSINVYYFSNGYYFVRT